MNIVVRDNLGRDVTNNREWYINTDGKIFYYTGDIDGPLYIVDNDYTWESVNIAHNGVYIVGKQKEKNINNFGVADANRIAEAAERTKKYVGG